MAGHTQLVGRHHSAGINKPACSSRRPWSTVSDSHDATTMDNLASRGRVAVTAADVPTLRSVQLKGRCIGVEPATPEDLDTAAAYCATYYGDIARVDGFPLSLCERFTPAGYAACVVDVDELFDQTPGPSAGRPLEGSRG